MQRQMRVGAVAALVVGACSTNQLAEITNANLLPRVDQLARPDWLSFSGAKDEFALRPVTAADLVTPEGQCAAPAAAASSDQDPGAAPAAGGLVQGGIALQMTECDVVRRAGVPDQVQIGTGPGGERSVVITYTRGPRPGIYRFAAGRLNLIERAPGAEPEAKQKKGRAKKASPG